MFKRLTLLSPVYKTSILLGMMACNFLLTGLDVLLSHSENHFFRFEVIPLIYSPLAVAVIAILLVFPKNQVLKRAFQILMWIGVLVGVLGTFFHLLGNATSGRETLYSLLISGSPIAAPIAFSGISCYALASERFTGNKRRSLLLTLVGMGFLGAVIAAYLDHARLGFIPDYTLIPLAAGILAALCCFYLASVQPGLWENYLYAGILILNLFVGLLGLGFHVWGDFSGTQGIVLARFLYRAPLLGPLLFCNLALLGGLSILPEPGISLAGQKLEENFRGAEGESPGY